MAKIGQVLNGESGFDARQKINEAIQDVEVSTGIKGDGIATALTSDIAAEINAATEKTTPIDGDKVPAIDSAAGNVLKWYSWANIKATLQVYFDTIYSTFSGSYTDLTDKPDLTVYAEKTNVLELDNTIEFTPDADYEPATKKYVDDSGGGGGGGHEYKENNVAIEQRAGRNILTNGSKVVLVDDGAEDETEENWFFEVGLDVDPTGKNDGDVWQYNAASEKTQPGATKPFDLVLNSVEANINADGLLSLILPVNYKVDAIILKETSGNAAGNISIGSTALGTDIVNGASLSASGLVDADILQGYFSDVNDTDLYISSSAWGASLVQLFLTLKKVS